MTDGLNIEYSKSIETFVSSTCQELPHFDRLGIGPRKDAKAQRNPDAAALCALAPLRENLSHWAMRDLSKQIRLKALSLVSRETDAADRWKFKLQFDTIDRVEFTAPNVNSR